MSRAKVAVTIEAGLLQEVDRWVHAGDFPSRSRALEAGLERLRADRAHHDSILTELAKLDPTEERLMAEEWLAEEVEWRPS